MFVRVWLLSDLGTVGVEFCRCEHCKRKCTKMDMYVCTYVRTCTYTYKACS